MSAIVGALAEAWAEVRHHRLRVLLSLVAIAVSVGAITAVVALNEYAWQQNAEYSDRNGGRPATLSVSAGREGGGAVDLSAMQQRFDRVSERFGFSHVSRRATGFTVPIQTSDYLRPAQVELVDPDYATMHRVVVAEGRWFRDGDEELAAPPIIVSEALWEVLGSRPVATHPTVTLGGDVAGTYQVVGVRPREGMWDTQKTVTLLFDTYVARAGGLPEGTAPTWEVWVGTDQASEIGPVLAADLRQGITDGTTIGVSRTDWASRPDPGRAMAELAMVGGVSLVLLLGGLSLVNVQLVAMRQRIREIGVRRSFGATAGRVFTVVMLENVVATAVAGVIGILIVVAVLRTPLTTEIMFSGLQDVPPFPMRAALTGLVAAVGIGALAGILPALVAMRVKVIDALRF
ncbi:ABC transporter permease [Microbacterium sp. No. 7]|uniref:ABC transporter permease n=1 Tax=Microbacterium sp. No. 7 TaxID=1714373 RepID=UPI0006CFA552|nr:ABC transporter permease [Microbacterium sp. No. 7]ALJ21272.1 hypothetical protein AOA12_15745 [Microbacterium sp. No. 7]